jgi:hypothetical protein
VLIGAVAVLVVFGLATCGGVAFLFLDFSAKRANSLPARPTLGDPASHKGGTAPPLGKARVSREEFFPYSSGRRAEDVLESLGRPDHTENSRGPGSGPRSSERWTYLGKTVDPVSGKPDEAAVLDVEDGVVRRVRFR